ncbi:MAG: tyrosine-type recombinase/integrase [Dehalococcoidia bacterium]
MATAWETVEAHIYRKPGNTNSLQVTAGRPRKWRAVRRSVTVERSPHEAPHNETAKQHLTRARLERARLETEIAEGRGATKGKITVRTLVARYFAEYIAEDSDEPRLGARTITSYRQLLDNHVLPEIGTKRLRDLEPLDVDGVYSKMEAKGLSGTTRLHAHVSLSGVLKWGVRKGLVDRNVAAFADIPKSSTKRQRTSTADEVARILAATKAEIDPAVAPMIALTAHTGMRLGEVLGLRWQDVDFEQHRLHVIQTYGSDRKFRKPKNESSARTVDLAPDIIAMLREHKREQQAHYIEHGLRPDLDIVFALADGSARDQDRVAKVWKRIRTRAGVPGFRFHDLRHATASLLRSKGVDFGVIAHRLGHASENTTREIYRHVLPEEASEAAAIMSRALGAQ